VAAPGRATIVGGTSKICGLWAAFVNAVSVNSLELDDVVENNHCHPAATAVPVALAMSEETDAHGRDLLVALVLGYEVTLRVADAACSHRAQGFGPTGTAGTFGAAAAASKLMGSNVDQTVNALGLAGTLAPLSLLEFLFDGTMSKTIFAGSGAHNGIIAALLAAQGITAPASILDGQFGFLNVASINKNDPSSLVDGLGKQFAILRTSIKPYACCRRFHTAIGCLLSLKEKNNIDWENQVAKIVIHSNKLAIIGHDQTRPTTIVAAQQSFPYCVAVALLEGHVNVDDFIQAKIDDPRRYDLANKIEFVVDPKIKQEACFISIRLLDGSIIHSHGDIPKGAPKNPLSERHCKEKFSSLVGPLMDEQRQSEIMKAILALDKTKARGLGQLLTKPQNK
jgi:2-methylcitrate dehydratase PrpD